MANYQRLNNIIGWIVFAIAAFVYLSTIEPTASFWDCGEYILSCFKLEVGHPPGAPLFLLLGRFFILLGGGTSANAAVMVNVMSGLASAFTILFLYWSITMLARKMVQYEYVRDPNAAKATFTPRAGLLGALISMFRNQAAMKNTGREKELTVGQMWAIFGSGIVGALAYTFSDSFWFSAVEGEVYASSSLCTAVVFWAILKWERVAFEPYGDRWLVFISFVVGLSIGVHLLNLLCIPTLVYVYYFKKFKPTTLGFFLTGIISVIILGLVQAVIIPGVVELSAKFELLFVNDFGMGFNSGTIFYFLLLFGAIIFGLWWSLKNRRPILNTAILSFAVLLIGYSSFFLLIIRSQANPPMDENNPENAINLLSYLKREQYGDWPIAYGQYYNSPLDAKDPYSDGDPVYQRDDSAGKYVIIDERKNERYNYDPDFCTYFPRMWSQQPNHEKAYQTWADIKGHKLPYYNPNTEETEMITKPTFGENLKFFFKYQLGHMYWRYFMWNFAGRQNDIQGHGIEYSSRIEGNWISGVKFMDGWRLGNQSKLPESVVNNKANNKFYFLPLILGLIGLVFHFMRRADDGFVVLLLFFFTGIAIVIYLNQYPYQPRERDYAYAGSFYAFAIWIGLGVLALFDGLRAIGDERLRAGLVTGVCTLAVPVIMGAQGWDDHNRSNRYTCRDYAADYLESCAKNAIIFTNGDNDTFPLWYAQEVEGIRTDVRVVNLSLANTDWYIEQLRRRAYDSPPVKLTLAQSKYWQGHRDFVPIAGSKGTPPAWDLKKTVEFIGSENDKDKLQYGDELRNYMPSKHISVPVDSLTVLRNGTVSAKDTAFLLKNLDWTLNKKYLLKADLLVLDIIASNNWERPIYFSVTTGSDAYLSLQPHFQLEGLAYRLVPLKPDPTKPLRISADAMYDNMMHRYRWGGLDKNEVYMDENNTRMAQTLRMQWITLANEYIRLGNKKKAVECLKKELEVLPERNLPYFNEPYDYNLYLVNALYESGDYEDANPLSLRLFQIMDEDMQYVLSLSSKDRTGLMRDLYRKTDLMQRIIDQARKAKQDTKRLEDIFKQYQQFLLPEDSNSPTGPLND
ncbi:MAG TPA: DUF2723 domain-containing protein [Bacteroidia bacterium]|jgi:tetratricopeptide (TPR) repeat protein